MGHWRGMWVGVLTFTNSGSHCGTQLIPTDFISNLNWRVLHVSKV